MSLIDGIKEAQAKRGWSDGELARQLGIAQSQWSRIQSRQREMGLRFLRAVAKVFPELQWKVADYVIKGG